MIVTVFFSVFNAFSESDNLAKKNDHFLYCINSKFEFNGKVKLEI